MKRKLYTALLPILAATLPPMLACALLTACTNEILPTSVGDDTGTPITLTATLASDDDAGSNTPQTRLDYTDETGSTTAPGVIVKWTAGDAFKLYCGSNSADFTINSTSDITDDGKTANFIGTKPDGTGEAKAFYPAAKALNSSGTSATSWSSIRLSMDGQTQTGDNNYGHIAAYDYMAATVADISGLPTGNDLAFHHLAAMMTVKITGKPSDYTPATSPDADNSPALLILSTDDAEAGFYNEMYASNGNAIISGSTSLALNGITWEESGFTAHLMIFPTDLTGKTFTLTVRCNDGTAYRYTTPKIGKKYVAGMRYTATIPGSKWTKVESSTTAQTLDDNTQATAFASGYGSSTSPYIISTAAELKYLQTQITGGNSYDGSYYRLTTDIKIATTTEWTPIGTDALYPFSGNFDGNGHTISGTLSGSNDNFGFFGYISNASIRNLHVEATVTNNYNGSATCYTGGLVGRTAYTPISGCSYKGTVKGGKSTGNASNTGGLIGQSQNITLSGCTVEAGSKVQGGGSADEVGSRTGGLVGYADSGSRLESCTNHAEIAGATDCVSYVGGVVGSAMSYSTAISIHNCRNHGKVSFGDNASKDCYAGGLIGVVDSNTTLSNSRNTGAVTGGKTSGSISCTGGLVAVLYPNNEIIGCTNEGTVSGGTAAMCETGGLVGYNSGSILHASHNMATATVAAGSVTGNSPRNYTGGLVGNNESSSGGRVYSCCTNAATVAGSAASSDNRIGGGNKTEHNCDQDHTVPSNN